MGAQRCYINGLRHITSVMLCADKENIIMSISTISRSGRIDRRIVAAHADTLIGGGVLAGLGGGIAMAFVAALLTRALDQDLWLQPKAIASLVLGSSATAPAGFVAVPVLVGLLIHLSVAALLGALFAIGMRRIAQLPTDYGIPEVTGLVYGLLIWLAAYFVLLPHFTPTLLSIYASALIIQHLVYGAVTGLLYAFIRPQPYASMAY